MHLDIIDPKTKVFSDFQVFVFSTISINENLEITEILQECIILKYKNTTSKTVEMIFK